MSVEELGWPDSRALEDGGREDGTCAEDDFMGCWDMSLVSKKDPGGFVFEKVIRSTTDSERICDV